MADYTGTANATTFSGKQFAVYVAEDDTVGVFNTSTNGDEFQRVDVEGMTLPTFTPNQEFEMRSGSGRMAEFGAMFSSSKGVETEFTLSGRLDLGSLPIFAENVLALTGGLINTITLPAGGYEPANISHNAAVGEDDWHLSLSVYFQSPSSGNSDSYKLSGCVCTNLSLTADMGTASGRYDYSATFKTGYKPAKGVASMSAATAINATNIFLSDQSFKSLEIHDVDDDFVVGGGAYNNDPTITHTASTAIQVGQSVTGTGIPALAYVASITSDTVFELSASTTGGEQTGEDLTFISNYTSINPMFNSIGLTFDSPTVFLGAQGDNAEPEVIARAVPELGITMSGSLKYDSETDKLLEAHRDPSQTSYMQFYIGNKTPTTLPGAGAVFGQDIALGVHNDTTLQWLFHKAKLISASVGSGDVASIDFEAKILDPAAATFEILHLTVGDSVA